MLHRFKTFETFEPKKLKERGLERLEKIMNIIKGISNKVEALKKSKQEINNYVLAVGDYIESYYLKMSKDDQILNIPTLENILDVMDQLEIKDITSSNGKYFTTNGISVSLAEIQKLQSMRTYSFNLSNKLKTNEEGNDHVFDIDCDNYSVIFYVEEKQGVGKSFTLLRGKAENSRYFSQEGSCAPNGNNRTIVWFESTPKKFEKILKALQSSDLKITKDAKEDMYSLD